MTTREILGLALGFGSPFKPPEAETEAEVFPSAPALPTASEADALVELARKGDRDAQRNLGVMYYRGRGVPLDRSEAFKWLTFAVRQGDTQADQVLEMIGPTLSYDEAYEGRRRISEVTGEPLPPREVESPEQDEFGQDSGGELLRPWDAPGSYVPFPVAGDGASSIEMESSPMRASMVGEIALPQVMLEPMPVDRRSWMWAAAVCVAIAAIAAGAYLTVVRNAGMAIKAASARQDARSGSPASKAPYKAEDVERLRVAAEKGDADSQFQLGLAYERGEGVAADFAEAAKWYRKAAEQGIAGAQNNIGVLHIKGKGVPVDYVEAYKWIYLAAKRGIRGAAYNRDQLLQYMQPDQIASALKDAAAVEARLPSEQ